jgi:hypothetical protein
MPAEVRTIYPTERANAWQERIPPVAASIVWTGGVRRLLGRNDLLEISGAYVDDLLRAAPSEYRQSMVQSLRDRFDCKESLSSSMTFTGLEIDKTRQ